MQDRSEVLERGGSGADWRGRNQHVFNVIPESAGPRLITFRGGGVHSVRPPGSQVFKAPEHFVAVMLAPATGIRASLGSDKVHEYDADVGMIVINPANVESHVTWSSTRENIVVALTPESLRELAAHEFETDCAELQPPPFGTVDPQALHLAQLLKAELTQRETPNELYVDSLVTMFGVHILRNYTGVQQLPPAPKGGLSNRSGRRVQEFLDVNFSRKISVAELAAVCGLSPRHFIQAFTKSFGEPPYKHLLRLRLGFAERLLVKGELSIAEIAHLSGFSSQSHLTTVMMKYRRKTPMQVRRRG
jgi:AraC family transcriptional regulator